MGSFISSLAGAADPRIHALLLVGAAIWTDPEDTGIQVMQ